MFRNFYSDGRLYEGQSAASSPPLGVAFDGQENSWIGLLSRPALSLLRKFRLWSGAPAEVRSSLIGEESEFLRQLNEMMPLTPPAAAAAQHLGAPAAGGSVSWLELHQEPPLGFPPPVRTLISQVLVSSREAAEGKRWVSRSGKAGLWWGSFLRGEERVCPPRAESCPVLLSSALPENARPPQLEDSGVQNTQEEVEAVTEQDHGYSSLEEELAQKGLLSRQEPLVPQMEEVPEEPEEVPPSPRCQNKNIAFIMGCPCSDDDDDDDSSSQSESDDDEDDGFDSEGSSDLSDSSSDEDDSERLWTSMCQSLDPYNPRNFTAQLHSTPAPASTPLPSSSSSPPSGQDSWDDSTSASEADEAESLRLLSSFSRSSDPYSPLDFKAPLRTRGPAGPPPKTGAQQNAASPPRYRKEAEERLDSGFSETSTKASKKVRFCDDVEEFFASCGSEEEEEDRRGPWEELARDRCRFLRRCLEVEQSIGFCLQPEHRRRVYQRLSAGIGPSGGEEKIN